MAVLPPTPRENILLFSFPELRPVVQGYEYESDQGNRMPSPDLIYKRLMRRMRSDARRMAEARSVPEAPLGHSENGTSLQQSIIPHTSLGISAPDTPVGVPLAKGPNDKRQYPNYPSKAVREAQKKEKEQWVYDFYKNAGLVDEEIEELLSDKE